MRIIELAHSKLYGELAEELATHPAFLDFDDAVNRLLDHAVSEDDVALASAAIGLGALINGYGDGFAPIANAVELRKPQMVKFLLQHGANPNTRLMNDYTPLHIAARNNDLDSADVLLSDTRTDIDAATRIDSYQTPLMVAAVAGNEEMVKFLLDAGADPSFTNALGEQAVTVANRYCRQLLEKALSARKPRG